jgi:hypothetical protein
MLCRISYAYAHQKLCSKQDAGKWVAQVFPERWRWIIEEALVSYAESTKTMNASSEQLESFKRKTSKK